jgi:hypothetical protein
MTKIAILDPPSPAGGPSSEHLYLVAEHGILELKLISASSTGVNQSRTEFWTPTGEPA